MNVELYFAPGACSFVPHVGLEIAKAATSREFVPKLVKLHKGEHRTPEYLAMNPDGLVPVVVVDGEPLTQLLAICDWIDRSAPQANMLPADPWMRAQAMSRLAWMNNTAHPTFTHVFMPQKFATGEEARADVKAAGISRYREILARIESWVTGASPYMYGERPGFHDAYAFTLLRWGGYAGIDPAGYPALHAYVLKVMQAPPVAAALARERVALDTYKPAAA